MNRALRPPANALRGVAMTNSVRQERTHWRDETLSERHRLWGYDCPAVDVDFLLVEYDRREPCAIVDYKHEQLAVWHRNASSSVIASLATKADIPAFVCAYAKDFSWLWPIPLNPQAKKWIPEHDGKRLTEKEWVTLLYQMRGRDMPDILPFAGETAQ